MLLLGLLAMYMLISPEGVSSECSEGMLRLVNTATINIETPYDTNLNMSNVTSLNISNAGRLEVCRSDIWGTIQMESPLSFWSEKNMLVACRLLLFDGALNTIPTSQLIPADQADAAVPVHYTNVVCNGTEAEIADCDVGTPVTDFSHLSDVYLVCWPRSSTYNDLHTNPSGDSQIGDIRLIGHADDGRGAVEISTDLGWSTICPDRNWTDSNANIICQLLGYESGTAIMLTLTNTVADRLVRDARCGSKLDESASSLRINGGHCTFESTGNGSTACASQPSTYAGVTCSTSTAPASVRLFELDNQKGVVEYLADDRWGVLCMPSSTQYVSEAMCEGLGYNRDDATLVNFSSAQLQDFESRMKPLWIPNTICKESDTSFSQCIFLTPLGYGTCGSGQDILAVDCGPKEKGGLSKGGIAGIVISVIVVLALIAIFSSSKKKR